MRCCARALFRKEVSISSFLPASVRRMGVSNCEIMSCWRTLRTIVHVRRMSALSGYSMWPQPIGKRGGETHPYQCTLLGCFGVVAFYLPLRNGNLALAQRQGCRCARVTLPLRSGK